MEPPSPGPALFQENLDLEQRLEEGELVTLPTCPFQLPEGDERPFLFEQRLSSSKKNISYHPETGAVSGFEYRSQAQATRLARLMRAFADHAFEWVRAALPRYKDGCRLDRAGFHPEEEATRKLRLTARNDLLHIDAFPSRPTQGARILRLYVNIHPTDARVWITSESFAKLIARHGNEVGLPNLFTEGWAWRFGQGLLSIFQPGSNQRTVYDRFMLRFHHFLKTHDRFQEEAPKRFWHFPPGTTWLAFTDSLSHADLRGRFALELSLFIAPHVLVRPELSPAALLERAAGIPVLPRAA
jgi:hypothetical protein